MPHITLEYSANLTAFDAKKCLLDINQALFASGEFEPADIKSRAVRLDDVVVGLTHESQNAFIHVTLKLLSGRSDAVKHKLGHSTLTAVKQHVTAIDLTQHNFQEIQTSVDLIDMQKIYYQKDCHK